MPKKFFILMLANKNVFLYINVITRFKISHLIDDLQIYHC